MALHPFRTSRQLDELTASSVASEGRSRRPGGGVRRHARVEPLGGTQWCQLRLLQQPEPSLTPWGRAGTAALRSPDKEALGEHDYLGDRPARSQPLDGAEAVEFVTAQCHEGCRGRGVRVTQSSQDRRDVRQWPVVGELP